LHGGPGISHDYLEPLEKIAATGRQVIFYDQVGCGNSEQPHNPRMWTVELFVDELRAVRAALGLNQIHLLGQSWGGMLAMEYVLTRPEGLLSLIIASSPASIPQCTAEMSRLVDELPTEVRDTIHKHEEAGTTDDPAYQEAMFVFYRRHTCRVDPWPDYYNRALEKLMQNPEVYNTMWGPSEFCATGVLKEWDIVGRLTEIHVPTLITSGRYDEVTPAVVETVHRGITGSQWVIFEESSHNAQVEETQRYLRVLEEFLDKVEAKA
jgi:proline-specific peptidase